MRTWNVLKVYLLVCIIICSSTIFASEINDPLPSWNDGAIKYNIIQFVNDVTNKNSNYYLSPEKRFAAFDQDGTLWVEQPMYTQVVFAFDRIAELAPQHPEWKTMAPFKYILARDKAAIANFTANDLIQIMLVTHTGMSTEAFESIAKNWLRTAKHPRWGRLYTDLVYQPMLEVLQYLRANGFKTYIVTGGGQDFVRVYSQQVYGIPPEQVIGTALKTQYIFKPNNILMRTKELLFNNNFAGKPQDIYLFIGQRPHVTFGNSIGDQQMLEYTQGGTGPHLMLLIHHDDAKREFSYGPLSKVGTFSDALMHEAKQSGWFVVSMKNDWKYIFPFEKKTKQQHSNFGLEKIN